METESKQETENKSDVIDSKQEVENEVKTEAEQKSELDNKEEDNKDNKYEIPQTPKKFIAEDNNNNNDDDDKDDEKQLFPSESFMNLSRKLQISRTQYQILFNLIQSQMLNIIYNTLLMITEENKLLLSNKSMLLSFYNTFISMVNTQSSSSFNWISQYNNCFRMYNDLLKHNYLLNEFNKHIITIIENDVLKEEDDNNQNDKKEK
eukprot:279043_1